MGDVDAVVFDLGNVLIDWNPRHLYRRLFEDEASMERFLTEICSLEWHVAHDRGHDIVESCAALAAQHPEWEPMILAWAERSEEMIGGVLHDTVEVLAAVKANGVRTYALSNMERETFPLRLSRYEFLHWFDGYVISGFEGVVKPEPEIFELLLERFDLDAARTVFIDDSPVNVEAARRIGINAIRFRSAAALRTELEALGVL